MGRHLAALAAEPKRGQVIKLALGTVQLGVSYGIANRTGVPNDKAVLDILTAASEHGYLWIDTAAAYGHSEAVLGRQLSKSWRGAQPPIATKIELRRDTSPQSQILEALAKLGRSSVEALLLHNEADLDHPKFDQFAALPSSGLVTAVGVSTYNPERALLGLDLGLRCLQVPCNLFNASSINADVFARASMTGSTVFVRSIFLQGLFFLSPDHPRAAAIPGAVDALRFLHDFCDRHALTPAQLAMAFGASLKDAIIVLGAESAAQVVANAKLASEAHKWLELVDRWLHERPRVSPVVYRPDLWPTV